MEYKVGDKVKVMNTTNSYNEYGGGFENRIEQSQFLKNGSLGKKKWRWGWVFVPISPSSLLIE